MFQVTHIEILIKTIQEITVIENTELKSVLTL